MNWLMLLLWWFDANMVAVYLIDKYTFKAPRQAVVHGNVGRL